MTLTEIDTATTIHSSTCESLAEDDKTLVWEHVDQLLRDDGEMGVNVPPGKTKELFITNNGGSEDRVKVRYESSFGVEGSVRLFQQISRYLEATEPYS